MDRIALGRSSAQTFHVIGWTCTVCQAVGGCDCQTRRTGMRALSNWHRPSARWYALKQPADRNGDLRALLDRQIAELEARGKKMISSDDELASTAGILRSVPGIGPAASTILIAEMPELGQITGEPAAALTGRAPIARDSGALRGKRAIGGGRRLLWHVMFQAALVASHHDPVLKRFADRLRAAGKPHKVVSIAVARKLVTSLNALSKTRTSWACKAA